MYFCVLLCKGRIILLSILMASVICFHSSTQEEVILEHDNGMCLHFSMREKDIVEHTNVKCYLCTLLVNL